MSVENDPGFWKWVAGGFATAAGTLWGGFKYIDARFDKKADKHGVNDQFKTLHANLDVHGRHIEKLFDQLRENEQRAQDRHERLMDRLSKCPMFPRNGNGD